MSFELSNDAATAVMSEPEGSCATGRASAPALPVSARETPGQTPPPVEHHTNPTKPKNPSIGPAFARAETALPVAHTQPGTLNRKPGIDVPWQRISGFFPGAEPELSCDEYERGAAKLIEEFKRLLRVELDADRKLRGPKKVQGSKFKVQSSDGEDAGTRDEERDVSDEEKGACQCATGRAVSARETSGQTSPVSSETSSVESGINPTQDIGGTQTEPSSVDSEFARAETGGAGAEALPVAHTPNPESSASAEPETLNLKPETAVSLRTYLWDPLPKVLRLLGISKKKMSQITKELTGMSANEVMDKMKAEDVRERMELDAAKFADQAWSYFAKNKSYAPWEEKKDNQGRKLRPWLKPQSHEERYAKTEGGSYAPNTPRRVREESRPIWPPPGDRHILYKMRKDSRRPGEFDLATWAMRHNFPNFARFRKGCLLAHGMTPQQIEMSEFRRHEKELCRASEDEFIDLEEFGEVYARTAEAIWKKHCMDEWFYDLQCAKKYLGTMRHNVTGADAKEYLEKK